MFKKIKRFLRNILPAYRVALRMENHLYDIDYKFLLLNKKLDTIFWYGIRKEDEGIAEAKKRFFNSIPKAEGIIRNHQLMLIEMIEKVDRLCTSYNITFWLEGGNLLGAVRHKGFIPWDDDFDIGMTRSDFEKLCDILEENEELRIGYLYDDEKMYAIPKILYRDKEETCFIDIVVFEEVTCNSWNDIEEKWSNRLLLQKNLYKELEKLREIKTTKRNGLSVVLNKENDNQVLRKVFKKYADIITDGDKTNYLIICMEFPKDMATTIRCYPKRWIFPLKRNEYEGSLLPLPLKSELYLQSQYEDIYNLPNDFGYQKHIDIKEMILRE